MNEDRLKALQLRPEARHRPRRSLWLILGGVALFTAASAYYAWPRVADRVRVQNGTRSGGRDPIETAAATGGTAATNASNAGRPGLPADGVVLTVSGYIVNRERIELSPRFMGQVKWIGVKKGDAVTNGQVVVLLDDAEYQARLAQEAGRLAAANVAVEKAQIAYDRTRQLRLENVESRQLEDDARLNLAAAKAAVQEIEGSMRLTQTYLDWTVIRSPIDGVVLEKLVDPNELVTPQSFGGTRGPSTALLAVANPRDLQVEIDLNESDLAKILLNQPCRVSPEAYPDRVYEGVVAEVAPEANRQKGTLGIKVQIRNPDRFLTPELNAKVEFLRP